MKRIIIIFLILLSFSSKGQALDSLGGKKVYKIKLIYLATKSQLDSLWKLSLQTFMKKEDSSKFVTHNQMKELLQMWRRNIDTIEINYCVPIEN